MALTDPPVQNPITRNPWAQPLVFLAMGVVWSIFAKMEPLAFLCSYVAALLLVNTVISWEGTRQAVAQLTKWQRLLVFGLAAIPPLARLARETINEEPVKAFAGMQEILRDKLAMQKLPCIFPNLVRTDQPQRFFLFAPDGKELSVQFNSKIAPIKAANLGHGLFLIDYNPRELPLAENSASPLQTIINVDGTSHVRPQQLITPRSHPRWFASAPTVGVAATVSQETDELIVLHRKGKHQVFTTEDGPTDCAITGEGKMIYVSHQFQSDLCQVDAASGKITRRVNLGHSQMRLALSPDEQLLAVAVDGESRGIQFISLPQLTKLAFVPLTFAPDWIVFGRDSKELVVSDRVGRNVFHVESSQAGQWTLGDNPIKLARPVVTMCRNPQGSRIFISATAPQLNHEPITANHFIEDTIHQLDLAKWEIVETFSTQRGGADQDSPGVAAHGISPIGLANVGNSLFMAFAGTNEVGRMNSESGNTINFTWVDEEQISAPHGIADLGEGAWAVSSPVDASIGIYDSEMKLRHFITLAQGEEDLEKHDPEMLKRVRGERTFFESTRAGLSCQSCHLHTDTDHCQHNIGAGELVGVLSVHGVAGTSPYLREGPYSQLRGLHDVVLEVYRGYLNEVDWDRAESLDRYMSSLPPKFNWRILDPSAFETMKKGMDAFVKAQCIQCHVPPAMTNLSQHPSTVVFPEYAASIQKEYEMRSHLDVPGLRSISLSPPYLHDGRAPTLESIFTEHNPSNTHGDTAALSKEELKSLIHFLEQL